MIGHPSHNEYFGSSSRKICDCGAKNLQIFFWGYFISKGQFRSIKYFCRNCFDEKVKENILKHQEVNGCKVQIKGFNGEKLPQFILELKNFAKGIPQLVLPLMERSY